MKDWVWFRAAVGTALIFAIVSAARGQTNSESPTNTTSTNYAVVSQGGSYRVWQKTVPVSTNQSGQTVFRTNSYTELATGMNYLAGGQWTPSIETIQLIANGGISSNGQHQVAFAADINTPSAVQITTPDGQNLRTHIVGLSFYDSSTGTNILFASLTNAMGYLVKSNRVVYSNAFTDCQADVRYTYRRSGIEQDIILDSQPPAPSSLGLNPQTTWLQVWTEFVNQPTPTVTPVQNGSDVRVEFGTMHMGRGRGFMLGSAQNSVPVTKRWVTAQGRTFLVEQVPFQNLASQLQTLPSGGGNGNSNGIQQIQFQGFPTRLPPLPVLAKTNSETLMLAKASTPTKKGVVLDYLLTLDSDQDDFTFQGDTTYDITGVLNMSDTTTIEGGAVIKFYDDGGDPSDGPSSSLVIDGNLVCRTGPYQIAMLTSENDDSVGEKITSSTGSPTTATDNCYISWDSENAALLNDLRFAFAYTGFGSGNTADVWNCQFVGCYYSVMNQSENEIALHNDLFSGGTTAVYIDAYATVAGEQITSDCSKFLDYDPFVYDASYYSYLYLTNSIIEGTFNPPSNLNTNKVVVDPAGTVFQTAGAGDYYLADGTYRAKGTTNLSAGMLSELAQKTTCPPVCPTSFTADDIPTITTNTTLAQAVSRDTNAPDLGYLYDPLDYMTTQDYSNCVITLTNGVVLGYWRNLGISLDNLSQLVSQGTPSQPNIIAYYSLVQEQPVKLMASDPDTSDYPANSLPIATYHGNTSLNPSVSMRFTTVYAPQVANYIMVTTGNYTVENLTLRDCETFGAGAEENWLFESGSVSLINNLFQYAQVYVSASNNIGVYNNLYRGDSDYEFHVYSGAAFITNQNNVFDGATVRLTGTMGYNAYLNGATDYNSAQTGDITTNLSWVAGPLGIFYQATNGPLRNKGGTTADQIGLYHYTVTANELPETNATVSMGFHYVAVGTNGLPLDSNGDGIPDYLEDSNGNGRYDLGVDLGDWNWPTNVQVVAWGNNDEGECAVPPGLSNVIAVSGGYYFSVALRVNGTVVAWGDNADGETNVPAGLTNVTAIAAGGYHTLALLQNGTVVAWGTNGSGQTNVPAGLTNVIAIAAGAGCSLAVRSDGTIAAWGYDGYGQTNVPSMGPASQAGAGIGNAEALLDDSTVTNWGYLTGSEWGWTTEPSGVTNIISIAVGGYHTLALNANGRVMAWGAGVTNDSNPGNWGQSIVPSGLSNVAQVSAGELFSMALQAEETVTAWGYDYEGSTSVPIGLSNVLAISAGGFHGLAIRAGPFTPLIFEEPDSETLAAGSTAAFSVTADSSGDTYQWQLNGTNISGATNATLTITNAQSTNAGNYTVVVGNNAGTLTSSAAALDLVTPPVITSTSPAAPSTNNFTNSLALGVSATAPYTNEAPLLYQWQHSGTNIPYAYSSNYTVTATSWSPWWQTNPVDGIYTVTAENLAGSTNSAAWTAQYISTPLPGSAVAWGENHSGECDYPTYITNAIGIGAGESNSLAVLEGGTVVAWGSNSNGQTNVPTSLTNATAVAAGSLHSMALTASGKVVVWGDDSQGQTNVPGNATNVVAISAGGFHCLALLNNGTVVQWGFTNAAIPSGLTNVAAIASGTNFDLALLSNSTVVAWGNNASGQTNVPAGLTNVVAIAAGGTHALALQQNGTVVAWGSSTNVPAGLSNVMAVAAGDNHSIALKNDGTVVAWGDNSEGQTNVPITLSGVKLIAAGGNHSLAATFSPFVQYPVNVADDLLLIYNTNSTDSATVLNYYLQHRPMVASANVLAVNFTQSANYETISPSDFTNVILTPVTNWLAANPTKRPQYVVLFLDLPSRVNTNTAFEAYGSELPSVSYQLATTISGWYPFVMHLNMGASNTVNHTNDCIAYINKLASFGTNGRLIISASVGGYGNTNYYIDDTETGYEGDPLGMSAEQAVIQAGASSNSVVYTNVIPDCGSLACHITNGNNVAGYFCWGGHSALGPDYAVNSNVVWDGNSSWYIVRTVESFNGRWYEPTMGNFMEWYSVSAFGGSNYSNTPIGVVSYVDEPGPGATTDSMYFGLWAGGKSFAIIAWESRNTQYFQAVGDPFVTR